MGKIRLCLLAAGLAAVPLAATAQVGRNYDVKTMNFDLWCQEQQHLPADRCDKRLPEDDKDFQAYRATIERYEIPYLQERQNDIILDREILHKDPVDNPAAGNPAMQQQSPSQSIDPRTPQP